MSNKKGDINITRRVKVNKEMSFPFTHCELCQYSGNKGRLVGTRKIEGVVSKFEEILNMTTNGQWRKPHNLLNSDKYDENNSVSWTIKCPICGSDKLVYE